MSTNSRSTSVLSIALMATTACLVAGCNKSSSASTAGGGSTGGTASAAAAGGSAPVGAAAAIAAATGGGGGGGVLDVSKQCKAIKPADIQALMKATLSSPTINPLECDYAGGSLKINIRLDDSDHKQYTLQASPAPGHTLTGIGDQAYWFEPVTGHTTPWLESYKGSVACEVSPADPDLTTLTYTGSMPIPTIADGDAAAYAQKEGAVCDDVFSAS